jgi:hypothetical protein
VNLFRPMAVSGVFAFDPAQSMRVRHACHVLAKAAGSRAGDPKTGM